MPDERAERTAYQALLALMMSDEDVQNYSGPYWNILWLDAALNALANAPRTGLAPLEEPDTAPTVELSEAGTGAISGGVTLEVVQTWVDAYGRETGASPVGEIETPEGLGQPDTAATLGTPTIGGADGFEGGLLEVWYTVADGNGGETLASPVASVSIPFQSGGLLSEVLVTLPYSPEDLGGSWANVYIRHRGGNVVLAVSIYGTDVSETLDGTIQDCYRALPLVNTTASNNSIEITGDEPAPTGAALTRFYIRLAGTEWSAGDVRLKLDGVDEWDPATVSYPLTYTGAYEELVAGFPPSISQIKPIRPVDLATEVSGILAKEHLEASGVEIREVEFTGATGDWAGALAVAEGDEHGALVLLVPTYEGQRVMNQAILYWWNEMLDTPAWQILSPFLPTEPWSKTPYGPYAHFAGTARLQQDREGGPYMICVEHPGNDDTVMPANLWYMRGLGDYLGFFGVYDDLATLQDEWGEPWSGDWCIAYVMDTESWYRYIPETGASSAGDTGPSTNLSAGSDCNFKLDIDGDGAETVTLTGLTGLTTSSLIAQEIMRAMNALGGKYQYLTCYYGSSKYTIYGPARDDVTLVVTNGDTLNVADDLKLGVANGGVETTGVGGWVKNPSSAMRGTFANVAALPSAADDGDSAFLIDTGAGDPGLMQYQTDTWVEIGTMTAS